MQSLSWIKFWILLEATYEKTYSAPLALTMFVTETTLINGIPKQIYPRLNYLPKSVKTDADRDMIIKHIVIRALIYSICLSLGFCYYYYCH